MFRCIFFWSFFFGAFLTASEPAVQALPVTAVYTLSDESHARDLFRTYRSIPGGITLEGAARGLPPIKDIRYDVGRHRFIVNDHLYYHSPVDRGTLREIISALAEENLLGFSAENDGTVYGALSRRGRVAAGLESVDRLLGRAVFHKHPRQGTSGFEPADTGTSITFRLHDYVFAREGARLLLSGSELQIQLIPIRARKGNLGTYLPDREALREGRADSLYRKNVAKLIRNLDAYLQHEEISRVVRYGEMAAFLRGVKAQGFNLESLMNDLQRDLRVQRLFETSA